MGDDIKKILLVDDETDITYIVDFVLSSADFGVSSINDSTVAVEELLSKDYSLLILDLMMPKMDGFTVLEKVRQETKLDKLSVLILSSRQLTSEETAFLSENRAEIMAKPFEPHRLLEKVREIVPD